MRMGFKALLVLLLMSLSILPGSFVLADDIVTLKITVTNPSSTETRTMPVKINLPEGIKPEDVIDQGNFKIDYDFNQSRYFAYQDVDLAPGQSMPFELTMRDIWAIPSEEISYFKTHTRQMMVALNQNQEAQLLGYSIIKRLDQIINSQQHFQGSDPQERITAFNTNSVLLTGVKRDVSYLDDLLVELNSTAKVENPKAVPVTRKAEKRPLIKFEISVANSSNAPKTVELKYFLPSELKPQDIVDSAGLKIGYDYQKNEHYIYYDQKKNEHLSFNDQRNEHYVYNTGVLLRAGESKKYIITVKDIWTIPKERIDSLKGHTDKVLELLNKTAYKNEAKSLADGITSNLNYILNSQDNRNVSVQMHIGYYRKNLQKLEDIMENISRLDKLFSQAGGVVTQVLEKKAGKALIDKSVFRGKAPDVATSWRVIWVIVGFLGLVSFLFFILWWTQARAESFRKFEKIQ